MADINFDDDKSFSEHIEVMLLRLDALDDELSPIFRELFPILESAQDDTSRRQACTVFNAGVVARLDKLAEMTLEENTQ